LYLAVRGIGIYADCILFHSITQEPTMNTDPQSKMSVREETNLGLIAAVISVIEGDSCSDELRERGIALINEIESKMYTEESR
jgi:hypothetical protein